MELLSEKGRGGRDSVEEAVRACDRDGFLEFFAEVLSLRAMLVFRLGDRSAAASDAARAVQVGREVEDAEGTTLALVAAAIVGNDLGPAETARSRARASGQVELECESLLAIAEVCVARGHTAGAREAAAETTAIARPRRMMGLVRRAEAFARPGPDDSRRT